MAMNDDELLLAYQNLHQIFPDDMHIARPLIRLLQEKGETTEAAEKAFEMAQRMLAIGRSDSAIGFLEMCRNLGYHDQDEVDSLYHMAQIASSAPMDVDQGPQCIFPLIERLSDNEAMQFLRQGRVISLDEDQVVVRQGEVSRSFYLILEGEMSVTLDAGNGQEKQLSILGPGHFFGEFACIYRLARSATVCSRKPSLLLEFSDLAITQLMQQFPIAGERLMKTVQSRMIHSLTYSHSAFHEIPEGDRRWLAEESRVCEFRKGDTIRSQGEERPCCCVIIYGQAEVWSKKIGQDRLGVLMPGDFFGDASRYIRLPKDTIVTATGHCLVCCIPGEIFKAFRNAYAGFEHWVEQQGDARQKQWHLSPESP